MTTLQPPPKTPRQIMAVGNENLQPPRTPQSEHHAQKLDLEKTLAGERNHSNPDARVQVPSSIPINIEEQESEEDEGRDVSIIEHRKEECSRENPIDEPATPPNSHSENAGERNPTEQSENDLELPDFDWAKFETDYQAAIDLADKEEGVLIAEFEKVCGVSY